MLDFLNTVTILDVAEKTTGRTGGPRKQRNPEGLAIRVFRDGSVFPSAELVAKFSLEYSNKGTEAGTRGFDVIDTQLYPNGIQVGRRILLVSPTFKTLPKVDLFGSTTYDEAGAPKSSVLDQGSKTFGMDDLIPSIEEIYGIMFKKKVEGQDELSEGEEFVDMLLVANPSTGEPWGLPNGKQITYIPKKVSRGEAKGSVSTIRREIPQFYAFLPAAIVNGTETPAVKEAVVTKVADTDAGLLQEQEEEMVTDMSPFSPVAM